MRRWDGKLLPFIHRKKEIDHAITHSRLTVCTENKEMVYQGIPIIVQLWDHADIRDVRVCKVHQVEQLA